MSAEKGGAKTCACRRCSRRCQISWTRRSALVPRLKGETSRRPSKMAFYDLIGTIEKQTNAGPDSSNALQCLGQSTTGGSRKPKLWNLSYQRVLMFLWHSVRHYMKNPSRAPSPLMLVPARQAGPVLARNFRESGPEIRH